ncbi:MAG: 5-formyltetrahydrofolate cyclo-ligase [Gammaproteobacteria bacterium]
MARHELRRTLRRRRAQIDAPTRHIATAQIVSALMSHSGFRRARRVALYSASGSEPDLWPLIDIALRRKKRVYLPRVRGQVMDFLRFQSGDRLIPGAFGLQQPAAHRQRISIRQLDLVIAPLVGFDERGQRLGQGGGYYDRALASLRHGIWRKPTFIGAAFRVQQVSSLDEAPWDVPLDAVVHDFIT